MSISIDINGFGTLVKGGDDSTLGKISYICQPGTYQLLLIDALGDGLDEQATVNVILGREVTNMTRETRTYPHTRTHIHTCIYII